MGRGKRICLIFFLSRGVLDEWTAIKFFPKFQWLKISFQVTMIYRFLLLGATYETLRIDYAGRRQGIYDVMYAISDWGLHGNRREGAWRNDWIVRWHMRGCFISSFAGDLPVEQAVRVRSSCGLTRVPYLSGPLSRSCPCWSLQVGRSRPSLRGWLEGQRDALPQRAPWTCAATYLERGPQKRKINRETYVYFACFISRCNAPMTMIPALWSG